MSVRTTRSQKEKNPSESNVIGGNTLHGSVDRPTTSDNQNVMESQTQQQSKEIKKIRFRRRAGRG